MKIHLSGLIVVMLLAAGCDPDVDGDSTEPTKKQVARVEEAANALVRELSGRLLTALEESGPLGAIEVCSRVAQEVARAHSRDGLLIRRVSLRYRNPANQASGWSGHQLQVWEREILQGQKPRALSAVGEGVGLDGTRSRELWYLQPLLVAPACLNCHGDPEAMAPELVARLAELYPQDRAVGYEAGDLRGGIEVRLGLEGQQPLPVLGPGEIRSWTEEPVAGREADVDE